MPSAQGAKSSTRFASLCSSLLHPDYFLKTHVIDTLIFNLSIFEPINKFFLIALVQTILLFLFLAHGHVLYACGISVPSNFQSMAVKNNHSQ